MAAGEDSANGDGFFLRELTKDGILHAADRALALRREPGRLARARRVAMAKDSSWARAIEQYERLFLRLIGRQVKSGER
ncbi:MAG: hypothetical protein HY553_02060 [Elusimicrobia bacterium]|nr:hypothetical protein [Elusimicrobiota bacterium]